MPADWVNSRAAASSGILKCVNQINQVATLSQYFFLTRLTTFLCLPTIRLFLPLLPLSPRS